MYLQSLVEPSSLDVVGDDAGVMDADEDTEDELLDDFDDDEDGGDDDDGDKGDSSLSTVDEELAFNFDTRRN